MRGRSCSISSSMKDELRNSMSSSAAAFQDIVWPRISQHPLVGGGDLKPVEATSVESVSGRMLSAAAIHTEALILQIDKLLSWNRVNDIGDSRYGIRRLPDGTEFIYVSWEYLLHTEHCNALAIC